MEKIIRIEESSFKSDKHTWTMFDGWSIITDVQTINIGISSGQSCCESFGCIITNDTVQEFIGSELVSISLTDTVLNNKKIDELDFYEGGIMFVNIETSNGLLQFAAYNCHNGYYGHEAVLISKQLTHEESL